MGHGQATAMGDLAEVWCGEAVGGDGVIDLESGVEPDLPAVVVEVEEGLVVFAGEGVAVNAADQRLARGDALEPGGAADGEAGAGGETEALRLEAAGGGAEILEGEIGGGAVEIGGRGGVEEWVDAAADGTGAGSGGGPLDKGEEPIGMGEIVIVEESDPLAAGGEDAAAAGVGEALLRLGFEAEEGPGLLVLANEDGSGVGGVIVDDDEFPGERFDALLGAQAFEDGGQAGGAVVGADDDGYFHSLSFRRRRVQGLRGGRSSMTLMPPRKSWPWWSESIARGRGGWLERRRWPVRR